MERHLGVDGFFPIMLIIGKILRSIFQLYLILKHIWLFKRGLFGMGQNQDDFESVPFTISTQDLSVTFDFRTGAILKIHKGLKGCNNFN